MPKHNAATHRIRACDEHAYREACASDAAVTPPQLNTNGNAPAEMNVGATRPALDAVRSSWQAASVPCSAARAGALEGVLAGGVSLALVPDVVAGGAEVEAPAVEVLVALVCLQLVGRRACAHVQTGCQSWGEAREDATSWREGCPSAFRSATYCIEHEVKGQRRLCRSRRHT